MSFASVFARTLFAQRPVSSKTKQRFRRLLHLEPLESRALLSAGALDQTFQFSQAALPPTFRLSALTVLSDGKILLGGTVQAGGSAGSGGGSGGCSVGGGSAAPSGAWLLLLVLGAFRRRSRIA